MLPVEQIARFARGVARAVLRLAFWAALAGAAIVAVAVWLSEPEDAVDVLGLVVLGALLALPPVVLALFALGVRGLAALPDRVRSMPAETQARLGELTRIAGEARSRPGWRTPWALWQLRGAALSARDAVSFALPLRVLAPGFLAATAFAALAAVAEIAAAFVVVIAAALFA